MARPTLLTNRKFLKLSRILGSDALALGHLEFLWHVANETGNPLLGDAEDVEAMARWTGEAGKLVDALTGCGSAGGRGFIFQRDDGLYEIHDYWHHAPDYVRKRADREAKRREKSDPRRAANGHTKDSDRSLTGQSPPCGRTPAPAPAPAPREESTGAARPPEPPEFLEFKSIFPRRAGSQPWSDALKAANARLREGHTWEEIIDGARRYAEYIRATNAEGTEHVLQAKTFCGPSKRFLEPFDLPASKADRRLAANLSAVDEARRRLFGGEH
jgi:hypothetical protein